MSTLYGRWRAGLITFVSSFAYAWYFVLPFHGSFEFEKASDGPRTVVNGLAALVIVLFAEIFRRAVRRAERERDQEIALRDLLLREIDHRIKNNFTIVASLLELQKRRQTSAEAKEALGTAVGRVHSFAAAHQSLYSVGVDLNEVAMDDYLRTLTGAIVDALFLPERITLKLSVDPLSMPRDQAVSIGLVLNEAVTNAAKHAFGPDESGAITVEFRAAPGGWRLTVADDGRGAPRGTAGSGLGSSLIESFAQRAGGAVATERLDRGTRVTLVGAAAPDPGAPGR